MKAPKIGRNAPCPCGSGKKYKHCCEGKDAKRATRLTSWVVALVGLLLVLLGISVVASFFDGDQRGRSSGRVWSTEHGHWHDAP